MEKSRVGGWRRGHIFAFVESNGQYVKDNNSSLLGKEEVKKKTNLKNLCKERERERMRFRKSLFFRKFS